VAQSGATAIEVGMVALPFVLFLFGILRSASFTTFTLENAVWHGGNHQRRGRRGHLWLQAANLRLLHEAGSPVVQLSGTGVYTLTETIYLKPRSKGAMLMQPNNAPARCRRSKAGRQRRDARGACPTPGPIRTGDARGPRDSLAG
jgi:hypothetical protein